MSRALDKPRDCASQVCVLRYLEHDRALARLTWNERIELGAGSLLTLVAVGMAMRIHLLAALLLLASGIGLIHWRTRLLTARANARGHIRQCTVCGRRFRGDRLQALDPPGSSAG